MRKRLFLKTVALYLVFGVLAFGAISTFITQVTYSSMQEYEAEKLCNEANKIASTYGFRYFNGTITAESLKDYLEVFSAHLSADIWVVSGDGTMVTSVQHSGVSAPRLIKDFDITAFGNQYYQIGTFYSYYDEKYLSVYAPVTVKYNVVGYVFLHEPVRNIYDLVDTSINVSYFAMFIVFAFAALPLVGIYFIVIRPLQRIVEVSKEYNLENFKPQAVSHSDDEIGYISNTISFMANKLDLQEEVQRKFISNISHDFRSPLTSIRGYIEAMIDGTIPPELYGKYLGVILNETDRLTKLTNNLLDLNRIGSRGAILEYTDFDINEIINKCAQSCEVQCNEKGLEISLNLYEGSMYVHADESKIQQVIYNLLDNAIKFSKPSTTIVIETTRKSDKLMISIKDQGIGIPKDAIDDIWNRFYKTDLSRGKDKKGTGLGLSIVKEIIQAHEQSINVISTVDVGTEFIFTLALAEKELQDDIE